MRLLIGIDDTDNLTSRGTGFLARTLAEQLVQKGYIKVSGITRHQLLVHDDVPYTSHNSTACICAEGVDIEKIIYFCRTMVAAESAPGSDAGLCIATADKVDDQVMNWGSRAKKEVLAMAEAKQIASEKNIFLVGLSGTHGGIIGALAGCGLHKAGNDGRFLWVKGMRKLMGVMTLQQIISETGVDEIKEGEQIINASQQRVLMPEWWRPLLINHKKVLLIEKVKDHPL